MPRFNLHRMSEMDRLAVYSFIESLGAPGDQMSVPARSRRPPYIPFIPLDCASG